MLEQQHITHILINVRYPVYPFVNLFLSVWQMHSLTIHIGVGDTSHSHLNSSVVGQLINCASRLLLNSNITELECQCQPGSAGRYVYLYTAKRSIHMDVYEVQVQKYRGTKASTYFMVLVRQSNHIRKPEEGDGKSKLSVIAKLVLLLSQHLVSVL